MEEITLSLTPWDDYQWFIFKEQYPRWHIISYGDRVTISNGTYEVNAVSMEIAIRTARRQINFDNSRRRYYGGCL